MDIKYKYKGKLQTDLLNLYELYDRLAFEERSNKENTDLTDDDIDDLINRID